MKGGQTAIPGPHDRAKLTGTGTGTGQFVCQFQLPKALAMLVEGFVKLIQIFIRARRDAIH